MKIISFPKIIFFFSKKTIVKQFAISCHMNIYNENIEMTQFHEIFQHEILK